MHAKESTELCPKRRRKEQQKENTRGREQNAPHTHPAVVSSRVKLPQSRGKGREEEHAKEKKKKKNTRIISRDDSSSLVVGEKSAYEKESRERERKRERSAQKSNKVRIVFHPSEKNFTSFPAKTLCAAWRGTHTHKSKSLPNLHRATRVPRIVLFEHVTS